MKERLRAFALYFSISIIVSLLVFLNFHARDFAKFLGTIPLVAIPYTSVGLIVIIIIFLWLRERGIEEREYQFITIVTHKFRTPLTGIKWAIDAFKKEVTHEEKEDILKQMENSSNKLMEIVDLLIGFVKFNQKLEYAFEAASLHEMVQESLEKYSQRIREKNMSFIIQSDPHTPLVIIDRRKIQFVIDMLIDNAVKYTPAQGSIEIEVTSNKKNIMVSVADNGMGMSTFEINHLFKKFFRSDEAKKIDTEGMGMGLHTAQVIMYHHKGRLWATSAGRNKGTTFYVELPLSQ